jgi:hypothetical protein
MYYYAPHFIGHLRNLTSYPLIPDNCGRRGSRESTPRAKDMPIESLFKRRLLVLEL